MSQTLLKDIYSIEQILTLINPKNGLIMLDGDVVRVGSMRLQTFKYKGTKCVNCGIEGSFFRKEQHRRNEMENVKAWHLNLYAKTSDGTLILMTKDHIIPRCKGGIATLDNLQPMCAPCNNNIKSNNMPYRSAKDRQNLLNNLMKFSWEK